MHFAGQNLMSLVRQVEEQVKQTLDQHEKPAEFYFDETETYN